MGVALIALQFADFPAFGPLNQGSGGRVAGFGGSQAWRQ